MNTGLTKNACGKICRGYIIHKSLNHLVKDRILAIPVSKMG